MILFWNFLQHKTDTKYLEICINFGTIFGLFLRIASEIKLINKYMPSEWFSNLNLRLKCTQFSHLTVSSGFWINTFLSLARIKNENVFMQRKIKLYTYLITKTKRKKITAIYLALSPSLCWQRCWTSFCCCLPLVHSLRWALLSFLK